VARSSSYHLADALTGLSIGSVVAGVCLWLRREVPTFVAVAAAAGGVSMVLAVGDGLLGSVSFGRAVATVAVAVAAGLGWAALGRGLPVAALGVIVLVSEVGIWTAVPDTEAATAVLAAGLPFAALALATPRVASPRTLRVTTAGPWIALAIVAAWAAVWGASGRPDALPGALTCFGVALVVPWLSLLLRADARAGPALVVHVIAVAAAARWAADVTSATAGLVRSMVVLGGLAVAVAISLKAWPAPRRPSAPPERLR
jgi:hypothetical protein